MARSKRRTRTRSNPEHISAYSPREFRPVKPQKERKWIMPVALLATGFILGKIF